jgi:ribosomal protein S18 acetylase RimI-like enzyme
MIGTPSQYKQSKLVGLHSPTRLEPGEYFMNLDGVASLWVKKYKGSYIIRDLFVLPEYRGKGYGKKLIVGITEFLKPKNLPIHLYVHPENDVAIKLYKNNGFVFLKNTALGDKFTYKS